MNKINYSNLRRGWTTGACATAAAKAAYISLLTGELLKSIPLDELALNEYKKKLELQEEFIRLWMRLFLEKQTLLTGFSRK